MMPPGRADLPPERVDAGAVTLRRIRATDAGAVAAAVGASLDHLRPWMPWATPDSADRRSQLARVAITAVALARPGGSGVETHCDEANTASAAIPRKLGYRLDRIEVRKPEAPGESGRLMIWVREHADPG